METKHDKVCPTCGTCPTCGAKKQAAPLPYWPWPIQVQPIPTWPAYPNYPYTPWIVYNNVSSSPPVATNGTITVSG